MTSNGKQQQITPEEIKRALRSLSDLAPEERTDLLTDVVRNVLPLSVQKDVATVATQDLPTHDKRDVATAAVQDLQPGDKKDVAAVAVQDLQPSDKRI